MLVFSVRSFRWRHDLTNEIEAKCQPLFVEFQQGLDDMQYANRMGIHPYIIHVGIEKRGQMRLEANFCQSTVSDTGKERYGFLRMFSSRISSGMPVSRMFPWIDGMCILIFELAFP